MYPQFTKVHVVSEVEASALRTICQDADVEVIAPAVDHQFVQHGGHPRATTRSSPYRLLFTGSVAIPGILNGLTTFLGGAYLGVRAEVPNVDMRVLARNASDGVLRMLSTFPNVTATSWVEDYVTEMASADVVVFPERGGSGIRHRVLQAMALGKAVIGSPEALSGIAASSGVDCIIAHSQPDFAKGLVKLLCDPEARKGIGDSARQLVLREYTLDTIGPRWLALYERATQKFCSTNPRTAIS